MTPVSSLNVAAYDEEEREEKGTQRGYWIHPFEKERYIPPNNSLYIGFVNDVGGIMCLAPEVPGDTAEYKVRMAGAVCMILREAFVRGVLTSDQDQEIDRIITDMELYILRFGDLRKVSDQSNGQQIDDEYPPHPKA